MRGDLGERDVADRHVEGAVLDAEVFERSGVDGGAGAVEMAGDLRGGGVQLDPGEHSVEGANPRKFPDPQPGSSTRTGPSTPRSRTADHMAVTTDAEV
ncbi:MAG: hypothetical protein M5T61_16575 [Acidimicrobiia bacterium]|nr:hypothetical protein [Acidimicrobiia bacterium]